MRRSAPVFRDPSVPHQIVLVLSGNEIVVSCNCMRGANGYGWSYSPLESRTRWDADEALAVYRKHLEKR